MEIDNNRHFDVIEKKKKIEKIYILIAIAMLLLSSYVVYKAFRRHNKPIESKCSLLSSMLSSKPIVSVDGLYNIHDGTLVSADVLVIDTLHGEPIACMIHYRPAVRFDHTESVTIEEPIKDVNGNPICTVEKSDIDSNMTKLLILCRENS